MALVFITVYKVLRTAKSLRKAGNDARIQFRLLIFLVVVSSHFYYYYNTCSNVLRFVFIIIPKNNLTLKVVVYLCSYF